MRERPIATLIFGILSIGFGLWNVLKLVLLPIFGKFKMPGNSGLAALTSDPAFISLNMWDTRGGAVLGVALLACGIGLLLSKNWARLGLIVYAVIEIVVVLFVSVVLWPIMIQGMERMPSITPGVAEVAAMVAVLIKIIFGLAYPVLLLIFMTRPNIIAACQPEQAPVVPVA